MVYAFFSTSIFLYNALLFKSCFRFRERHRDFLCNLYFDMYIDSLVLISFTRMVHFFIKEKFEFTHPATQYSQLS